MTLVGVWIFSQNGNNGLARVIHNSVYLELPNPVSYNSGAIYLIGGSSGKFPAEIFNNLAVNKISTTSTNYGAFALVDGNTARGFLLSDYNLLYADGTNGFLGAIGRELGGTEQNANTIADFISISQTNQNSVSFLPELNDPSTFDLSISTSVTNPDQYRVPINNLVPNDITGITRNANGTFVGAYESSATSGLNDLRATAFTLYPNPARDFVQINTSNGLLQENKVQIYSLAGAEVLHFENLTIGNGTISPINIQSLSSGMYVMKITSGNSTSQQKLLIH